MNYHELRDRLLPEFRQWCKEGFDYKPSSDIEDFFVHQFLWEMFRHYQSNKSQYLQTMSGVSDEQLQSELKRRAEAKELGSVDKQG